MRRSATIYADVPLEEAVNRLMNRYDETGHFVSPA
jgi:hypothetical protein